MKIPIKQKSFIQLEKISTDLFKLEDLQKICGGNFIPIADSCTNMMVGNMVPLHKLYQEDLDKEGTIVAWGDTYNVA